MPNFGIIPEKEFVLFIPKDGTHLKSAVRSSSFENVRNNNGCVMPGTGEVDLSIGLNDTI